MVYVALQVLLCQSFKDTLDFLGNIFAGSTTFGAAIVAGFLFNSWQDQHNKALESNSARELIQAIVETKIKMRKVKAHLKLDQIPNLDKASINKDIGKLVNDIQDLLHDCQDKLEVFNILKNEDSRKSKKIFTNLSNIVEINKFLHHFMSTSDSKFIENKEQFNKLVVAYIDSCDEFNYSLKTYVIAE